MFLKNVYLHVRINFAVKLSFQYSWQVYKHETNIQFYQHVAWAYLSLILLRPRETVCVSLSRCCEEDSLISSLTRDMLSTNKTQEKSDFGYWYIINIFVEFVSY